MGGAPWTISVHTGPRQRIDVVAAGDVQGTITDKGIVDAAILLLSTGGDLASRVYNGTAPFRPVSDIMASGPAMDTLNAELVGPISRGEGGGGVAAAVAEVGCQSCFPMLAARKEAAPPQEEQLQRRKAEEFGGGGLQNTKAADPKLLRALLGSQNLLEHACEASFKAFDTNGDGVLQLEEVQVLAVKLCEQVGISAPRAEMVERLFHTSDTSNDGVLQMEEFVDFYRAVLEGFDKQHQNHKA